MVLLKKYKHLSKTNRIFFNRLSGEADPPNILSFDLFRL